MAKKHWIQDSVKYPGAFTKKAEEADMGVQQFAHHVLANPGDYSSQTVHQARLAETFNNMNHKK